MHLDGLSADRLVDGILEGVAAIRGIDIAVAPPFPLVPRVAARARGTRLVVGAQNLHWEDRGAFTGEVSAPMLVDAGASFTLVGHSERRVHFGERDADVARKVEAALRSGLRVVLCVGEREEERDAGRTIEIVDAQLREGLCRAGSAGHVVIAYEPVWAIGTGRTPTIEEIREVHRGIRERLRSRFGPEGDGVRALYGGSVTPENAAEILGLPEVDGSLVGGASLDARRFLAVARAAELPASPAT